MKHESKKAKETPEEAARREKRERARARRVKRQLEAVGYKAPTEPVADAKERPAPRRAEPKLVSRRSDPPPVERESDVPIRKEKKRMKTVITQDNLLQMLVSPNPEDAKIQFCDEHHDRLVEKLKLHGIDHLITEDVETLKARIAARGIDPLWHAQEALIKLAINTIGSDGVIQYRCPICALNKFDFIAQIGLLMKRACVRKPS
jgi:hypothetical protein